MSKVPLPIAFVLNDFTAGGAQELVAMLARGMDPARFSVSIISLRELPGRKDFYHKIPKDISVHRLNFSSIFDIASWRELFMLMRRERFALVISGLFFANTVMRLVGLATRTPVIATEHNTYIQKSFFARAVDAILAPVSPTIIAVSRGVAKYTARTSHIPLKKFTVIPNGVDIATLCAHVAHVDSALVRHSLGMLDDDVVLLCVARLTAQKNHRALLEAFARIAHTSDHAHVWLVLAGQGVLHKELKAFAHTLGISSRVLFLSHYEPMAELYAIADVCLSVSLIEGYGIARAEARALGIPIITTPTAGTDELVVHGVHGFVTSGFDVASIEEALMHISPAWCAEIRRCTAESLPVADMSNTVHAYESLIARTVNTLPITKE